MSTTVLNAYRVAPTWDVATVLDDLQLVGIGLVQARLHADYQNWLSLHPEARVLDLMTYSRERLARFTAQIGQLERSPDDLEVMLTAYHIENSWYIRAWAGDGMLNVWGAALDSHPALSEFNYWNGSDDQLDVMSEEEWYARRDIWHSVDRRPYGNLRHLTVEVLTPSTYPWIDPYLQAYKAWRRAAA